LLKIILFVFLCFWVGAWYREKKLELGHGWFVLTILFSVRVLLLCLRILLEILATFSFSPSAQIAARLGVMSLSFCEAKRKLGKEKTFSKNPIFRLN